MTTHTSTHLHILLLLLAHTHNSTQTHTHTHITPHTKNPIYFTKALHSSLSLSSSIQFHLIFLSHLSLFILCPSESEMTNDLTVFSPLIRHVRLHRVSARGEVAIVCLSHGGLAIAYSGATAHVQGPPVLRPS